ncbi:MAG: hypothetical protein JO215_13150, partial [Ktedonobacteraceae bacterium]|nr:hypothetical protein [Ktedonobacteraceae bacterium]
LWRYLPELAELANKKRLSLPQAILQVGGDIKLLRPSTRIQRVVPEIDWQEITPPPIDLTWRREPRYAHKTSQPGSHTTKKAKREPGII